jgi:hypothetical protein
MRNSAYEMDAFFGKLLNVDNIFKAAYHLDGVFFHLFVRREIRAEIEGAISFGLELVILPGE